MGLLLLILLLALVGGFLGNLLELAAWLIVVLAAVGAVLGFFVYRAFKRLKEKVT